MGSNLDLCLTGHKENQAQTPYMPILAPDYYWVLPQHPSGKITLPRNGTLLTGGFAKEVDLPPVIVPLFKLENCSFKCTPLFGPFLDLKIPVLILVLSGSQCPGVSRMGQEIRNIDWENNRIYTYDHKNQKE